MECQFNVVLADDHVLVRGLVRKLLEEQGDGSIAVTKEVSSGSELVEAVQDGEVDLVISDILMPDMSGLEALEILNAAGIEVPVLFLTGSAKQHHVQEAAQLKAAGYLHKCTDSDEFFEACWSILNGEHTTDPVTNVEMDEGPQLTVREKEIVQMVAKGLSNDQIAATLHLSVKTVERHRYNILAKLDLHSGVDLCRYAFETGLVDT